MPRAAPDLHLALPPRAPGEPAGRWLCAGVRAAIADGRLDPGTRLPSTRVVARAVGLARRTVIAAFEELQSQGFLEGRARSGTFVAASPEAVVPGRLRSAVPGSTRPARRRTVSAVAARTAGFDRFGQSSPRAFRAHLPALEHFPVGLWARLVGRRARTVTAAQLTGSTAFGYLPLREALADYLRRSRGVRCEAARIAIVSGVQEALSLVTRLVLDPGGAAGIEDPGYSGAARVFESANAAIVPLPVDGEGVCVPSRRLDLRLAYVTPAHQFPLGMAMSLSRRLALLAWAHAAGATLVEDDYDSEYRYSGAPLPSLQGLDRRDAVVFVGSFAKVLFPSLRLGYVVVPPDLVDPLAAVLSVEGRQSPGLEQAVLADFLGLGHFHRHVRRMREIYGARLATLQALAQSRLSGALEVSSIQAGLQVAAVLQRANAEAVAAGAALHGVDVTPLSRYARQPMARDGLLLGFGAADQRELARGVEVLARVLDQPRGVNARARSAASAGTRGRRRAARRAR